MYSLRSLCILSGPVKHIELESQRWEREYGKWVGFEPVLHTWWSTQTLPSLLVCRPFSPKVHFISYSQCPICVSVTLSDNDCGVMRKVIWLGLMTKRLGFKIGSGLHKDAVEKYNSLEVSQREWKNVNYFTAILMHIAVLRKMQLLAC